MQLDLVRVNKLQEKIVQYNNRKENKVRIKSDSIFAPQQLGSVKLYHSDKGFHVVQDNKKHEIKKWFVDPVLRTITKEQIKAFQKVGYFSINQMNDGEFSLKAKGRINGGGVIGCIIGASVAKVGVSLLGHGTIFLIGALTGPAAPATVIALESYFGAAIELASMKAAIAGGIAGGVATGPV